MPHDVESRVREAIDLAPRPTAAVQAQAVRDALARREAPAPRRSRMRVPAIMAGVLGAAALAALLAILLIQTPTAAGPAEQGTATRTPTAAGPSWTVGSSEGTTRRPAAFAWASTVPYRDAATTDPPVATLNHLASGELVIHARLGGPGTAKRRNTLLPLRVAGARHLKCCDSFPPPRWVDSYEIIAAVTGRALVVTVYSRGPLTPTQVTAVDRQLAMLVAPPIAESRPSYLSWAPRPPAPVTRATTPVPPKSVLSSDRTCAVADPATAPPCLRDITRRFAIVAGDPDPAQRTWVLTTLSRAQVGVPPDSPRGKRPVYVALMLGTFNGGFAAGTRTYALAIYVDPAHGRVTEFGQIRKGTDARIPNLKEMGTVRPLP